MRYFLILLFVLLTACGSAAPSVKPFKMDIQQGNVVTSKMLLQLRPGMTKSQVRFIMGTPLIVDSFHKDRWDYFYQLRQAGKIIEQRRVILDFDKELLTKVRGDVVPEGSVAAGSSGAATGSENSVAKTITVEPKPKQEKSWAEKLKFWEKDEPVKATTKPAAAAASKPAPVETPSAANVDVPAVETPSVLAVPIGGVLAPDSPAAEEPVVTSPVVETPPVAEVPPALIPKAETKPTPMPVKPAPDGLNLKQDERLIFRLDRNLDLKNLDVKNLDVKSPNSENLETSPTEAMPAELKAKPKKVEQPVPVEEEPGYFERMLEKIGF
jgi:outer membrane protein assembly factor BamE